MNAFKKILLAAAFVGTFGVGVSANAAVVTSSVYGTDAYLSSARGEVHSTSFDLSINNFVNGFVAGVDTLESAVLSVFLKDDKARDGNEVYKITFGADSSTQNVTGNDFSDVIVARFLDFPIYGPSSVIENITLNAKSITDLSTDGLIKVTVEATSGDFNFDKAYLTANITKGEVGSLGNAVPEPTTVALLGLGLLGFAASRRKSAKSKNA